MSSAGWQSVTLDAPAAAYLRARLAAALAFDARDARHAVRVAEVPRLAAAASVSIRRGGASRVPMLDLSLTARWEGRSVLGAARVSGGDLVVDDLLPEDVYAAGTASGGVRWLDFPVRVTQRDPVPGLEVDVASLAVARTLLVDALRDAVRGLAALLMRVADGSAPPESVAAEAARCAEDWARERAGAEARLRALATEALERKTAADALAHADADAAALAALANATTVEHVVSLEGKAVAAGASPSISPSVWNVSAWAWEAREFTPWARARLNELLAGVDVDVPSGHVKIVEVDSVSGDASVNLRKGHRLVLFDLEIVARWEGTLMDEDGRKVGAGDGELVISQLDQDTGPSGTYVVGARASSDGGKADRVLATAVAKWAAFSVKRKIAVFVGELLEKGR